MMMMMMMMMMMLAEGILRVKIILILLYQLTDGDITGKLVRKVKDNG